MVDKLNPHLADADTLRRLSHIDFMLAILSQPPMSWIDRMYCGVLQQQREWIYREHHMNAPKDELAEL